MMICWRHWIVVFNWEGKKHCWLICNLVNSRRVNVLCNCFFKSQDTFKTTRHILRCTLIYISIHITYPKLCDGFFRLRSVNQGCWWSQTRGLTTSQCERLPMSMCLLLPSAILTLLWDTLTLQFLAITRYRLVCFVLFFICVLKIFS